MIQIGNGNKSLFDIVHEIGETEKLKFYSKK